MKEVSETRKGGIPPHSHCQFCGKSVPINKPFCSKKCAEEVYQLEKKSQQSSRIYMVVIIIIIIVVASTSYELLAWTFR